MIYLFTSVFLVKAQRFYFSFDCYSNVLIILSASIFLVESFPKNIERVLESYVIFFKKFSKKSCNLII